MTPALSSLALFAAWALVLLSIVVVFRVAAVLRGKPANSWTRGQPTEDPGLVVRAGHAHLNTLESLPVFAAIVLAAAVSGQSMAIDALAPWVLYARIAQSAVHLVGISHPLVLLRAAFFGVQVVLFVVMLVRLFF